MGGKKKGPGVPLPYQCLPPCRYKLIYLVRDHIYIDKLNLEGAKFASLISCLVFRFCFVELNSQAKYLPCLI